MTTSDKATTHGETPEDNAETKAHEEGYKTGRRAAYIAMFYRIAGELNIFTSGDTEAKLAALLAERLETVNKLREVCAVHGDLDWDDDLAIPDIIERHLARALDDAPRSRGSRRR